ncbi:MAG: hypothetical protein EOO61_09895 [Hymenobacter sp.]|nr:MAG: hypothetical protein EOO61_09895 [Hymenobacter sp.]
MKAIGYFFLLMVCIGTISCQKEITLTNPSTDSTNAGGGNIPPSTNGDLLIKSYGRSGADSNVTTYTYNSAKQLIATYNVMSANSGSTTYYGFERNATGLIIRRKQYTTSGLIPISADTSITVYHYSSSTTPQITYSTSSIGISGFSVDDSTIYTYNTAGKLTRTESYQSSVLTGTNLSQRQVFTYDVTGNVTKLELFDFQNGIPVLLSTNTFTYDNKTASIGYTEAEAIVISGQPAAIHNPTGYVATSTFAPGISANFSFTYNASNRPATYKQIVTQGTVATTTNFTLYYQ